MASKKQKEHMVQNVVNRVNEQIKHIERNENLPERKLEQALWNAYYDHKYKNEK